MQDSSSPLFSTRICCNTMVLSWLSSSIQKNIHSSVMYGKIARQVCLDLKHCFDQESATSVRIAERNFTHLLKSVIYD